MQTKFRFFKKPVSFFMAAGSILVLILVSEQAYAQDTDKYKEYKGKIVSDVTGKPLEFASITLAGSNIATVSNTEGEFSLKVPVDLQDKSVLISYLGYANREFPLSQLKTDEKEVRMAESIERLPEVSISAKDPEAIVKEAAKKIKINYTSDPLIMTAFYRESISKGKKYASLSEAVVEIYKEPYTSFTEDEARLFKARKSTDYRKLDTLVLKLQGGPYNTIKFDVAKNRELILDDEAFQNYSFSYTSLTSINNRPTHVISFRQLPSIDEPLFYGKLFIDAQTYAISKVDISLNLENEILASKYFVKKKPINADVTPIKANYQVDYKESKGKWFQSYSRLELGFKVNWKKKLFNSNYDIIIEMAVTDWKKNVENMKLKSSEKLRTNVILTDKTSGFADPDFWGEYNIIEPEKSIENAIEKIQRKLD